MSESDALQEMPPSAKLVHLVLEEHLDEATLADVVDETNLQPRTARYALKRLVDASIVRKRPNPSDARQCLYTLKNRE